MSVSEIIQRLERLEEHCKIEATKWNLVGSRLEILWPATRCAP